MTGRSHDFIEALSELDTPMSQDPLDMDPVANRVFLVVDVPQLPVELQDGVLKIIKYAPHKNLVSETPMPMQEDGLEHRWHLTYVCIWNLVNYALHFSYGISLIALLMTPI